MTAHDDLVIVGIGATRSARDLTESNNELILEAALAACADAGVDIRDIDGIVSEATHGHPTAVEDLQAAVGLDPSIFTAHIGIAGSGSLATTLLAEGAIATEQASMILCVYGLKLPSGLAPAGGYHSDDPYKFNMEMTFGDYPQPVYMAAMAQRYCAIHGVDTDLLGHVGVSARAWGAMNPTAIRHGRPLTHDQYLDAPFVAEPFRTHDCCLVSDGACAFIMTTRDRARDLRHHPVTVAAAARAIEPITEHEFLSARPDKSYLPSRYAGPRALARAGLSVGDIDAALLYDCFSIIPVIQLEDIGFCEPGEGLDLYARGDASPGGRLPVNTHGGLMAHSYMPGINMVVEGVLQLRREVEPERQVPNAETIFVGAWAGHEHTSLILTR